MRRSTLYIPGGITILIEAHDETLEVQANKDFVIFDDATGEELVAIRTFSEPQPDGTLGFLSLVGAWEVDAPLSPPTSPCMPDEHGFSTLEGDSADGAEAALYIRIPEPPTYIEIPRPPGTSSADRFDACIELFIEAGYGGLFLQLPMRLDAAGIDTDYAPVLSVIGRWDVRRRYHLDG